MPIHRPQYVQQPRVKLGEGETELCDGGRRSVEEAELGEGGEGGLIDLRLE